MNHHVWANVKKPPIRINVLTLSILIFCSLAGSAGFATVDCSDVSKVAKEAVAYSLVGAWEPFTTHACFKGERFHYFHPERGEPEGEVIDASKLIWFNKKTDKYTIESVTPKGNSYDIAVKFVIGGRTINTTYVYDPRPQIHQYGICGYVTNPTHGIYRWDCVVPSKLKATGKAHAASSTD